MEGLTKQQLILLALLVSFVTSIATGIVTVSLVNQAPPALTQTINRVVEKTIERVVTEPSKQAAAVVTKETVVVKADDVVVAAVEKNARSIVRIKEVTSSSGEKSAGNFAGLGLILSKDGTIVADIGVVYRKDDSAGNAIPESYLGIFADGTALPLDVAFTDKDTGLLFFKPLATTSAAALYLPPLFGTTDLKLGQTVFAIGGAETNAVSTGIVANIGERAMIRTDIRSDDLVSGSVLFNLSGEAIGINAGVLPKGGHTFLPLEQVQALLVKMASSSPVAH